MCIVFCQVDVLEKSILDPMNNEAHFMTYGLKKREIHFAENEIRI